MRLQSTGFSGTIFKSCWKSRVGRPFTFFSYPVQTMLLLSGSKVSKRYGSLECFSGAGFAVHSGQRIGLIGANGSGKTTLLRIMAGEESHRGTIDRRSNMRIAMLSQEPSYDPKSTVRNVVVEGVPRVGSLRHKIDQVNHALADSSNDGRDTKKLLDKLGKLQNQFEAQGGHEVEWRAEAILDGLGFPAERHDEPVKLLSGGELNRVSLARLLIQDADLWLLDEPTNHLDIDGIEFLERTILSTNTAAVIVSHDRRFLDHVTSYTWEVRGGSVECYEGNYSRSREIRQQRLQQAWREYMLQQEHIQKEKEFIRRYKAGQRAREAKGRAKRLERLEKLEKPEDKQRVAALDFDTCRRLGNRVLQVNDLSAGYDGETLFSGMSFELQPGETLALVGPNGSGKTTFLETILGNMKPMDGNINWGSTAVVGTLGQHDVFPDEELTPISYLRSAGSGLGDQELCDTLAAMVFPEPTWDQPVHLLSGGEKRRLMLTHLLLEGHNVLLLDEPTNHLDVQSAETLELALCAYEGSLLVISHDRHLLDQIADRVIWLENGNCHLTYGGFKEAAEARAERRAKAREQMKPAPEPEKPKPTPKKKKKRKKSPYAGLSVSELEERIIGVEEDIEELRSAFNDPALYKDGDKVKELKGELDELQEKLSTLEEEYFSRAE